MFTSNDLLLLSNTTSLSSSSADNECTRPYTDNEATDRLMYSFWGFRTFFYSTFFIVLMGQVYHEYKHNVVKKEGKRSITRLLVFSLQGMFCLVRVIGDIVHYSQPCSYRVGSWWYFCFSWGTFFLICSWIYISEFWTKMLYTFYIKDDIHLENTSKVTKFFIGLITVFFCWEVFVSVLCVSTHDDWSLLEAIGFLVYLISFGIAVTINGIGFVKVLKKSGHKSYTFDRTIQNTKVLLATAVIVILMTIAHDVAFVFILDQHTYKYYPSEVSITMVIDGGQLLVVLFILSGGRLSKYFLFKRTRVERSESSYDSGKGAKKGSKSNDTPGGTGISFTISKQQESVAPFDGTSNIFIEEDTNSKQIIVDNNIQKDNDNIV